MNQRIDRMKKENKRLLYSAVAWGCCLIVALSGGCTEADWRGQPDRLDGEWLQVEIPVAEVSLQKLEPVDTKAVAPGAPIVYKRAIVLQYSEDGEILLNAEATDIETHTIGTSISAKLVAAAKCKIYVFVVNETATTGGSDAYSTEAKLKDATYNLYNMCPNPKAGDIPLIGSLQDVDVVSMESGSGELLGVIQNPTGTNNTVMLSRIAAELKIILRYKVEGFQIDKSVVPTLRNVPRRFHLLEQPLVPPTNVYPEGQDYKFEQVSLRPLPDAPDAPFMDTVCYVPRNHRGINENVLYPKDKWSGTAPGAYCTYLTFTAANTTNADHKLIYSFYFGGNNTSDFNVEPNHVYTMNSTIMQRNEGDNRIKEAGLPPEVITEPTVESVSATEATIKGTVADKHEAPITKYGFYYKQGTFAKPDPTTDGGTLAGETSGNPGVGTTFSHTLTGLTADRLYSFVAYAASFNNGTSYGKSIVFKTNRTGAPILVKQNPLVSGLDGKSVSSTGNITTGVVTKQGVVWSTTPNFAYDAVNAEQIEGTTTDSPYDVNVSDLTPGTTYYYRYFASNDAGTTYGSEEKLVRTFDKLTVKTDPITSTIVDFLNVENLIGKKDAADPDPTAGKLLFWKTHPGTDLSTSSPTISFDLSPATGLRRGVWPTTDFEANQTYWYASCYTNPVGTTYSDLQSFTVSAVLPPATASPNISSLGPQATNITFTTSGRNTEAIGSNGANITSINSGTSKTILISDHTKETPRTPTIFFTTTSGLPLRAVTTELTQYGVYFVGSFNITPGNGKTDVGVSANIPWKATSNADWCRITNAQHTGANTEKGDVGTFSYAVDANDGSTRSATITVAGTGSWTTYTHSMPVTQSAGGQVTVKPIEPGKVDGDVIFEYPYSAVINMADLPPYTPSDPGTLPEKLTREEAKKRCAAINAQTVSLTYYVSPKGVEYSGTNGFWNEKLSPLVQVMCADLGETENWVAAYDACRGYAKEGGVAGQWRLPTQRELKQIGRVREQLEGKSDFTRFSEGFYWTSTEAYGAYAHCTSFAGGGGGIGSGDKDKTDLNYVRCVRDL